MCLAAITSTFLSPTLLQHMWLTQLNWKSDLFVSPQFICDMTDVRKVQASLEEQGMQVTSSGLEFAPRTLMSLDQDQLNAATMLIEALSDNPDVMRVWDNIQADSWECFRDTLWTLNLSHMDLILYRKVLSPDALCCLWITIWKVVHSGTNWCQNKILFRYKNNMFHYQFTGGYANANLHPPLGSSFTEVFHSFHITLTAQ